MTLVARVFTFISGGQDTYLSKALESFDKCCWGLSQLIFGASAFASSFSFHGSFTEYDILESDFFDVFFAHGAFRLLSYITVITWGIRLARKGRHLALLMVWAATCFYSAAAGHVVFNAMNGMTMPVILIALQRPRLLRARNNA